MRPVLPDDIGYNASHVETRQGVCCIHTQEGHMAQAVSILEGHSRRVCFTDNSHMESGSGDGVYNGKESEVGSLSGSLSRIRCTIGCTKNTKGAGSWVWRSSVFSQN